MLRRCVFRGGLVVAIGSRVVLCDEKKEYSDVVIVGAGIAGASLAMHLGSSFSVTVVERGSPGSGSTGLSAATVWNPGFDESMPVLFKVRNGSAKIYRQLEVDGFKCDLKISGSLTLALDASQNTFIQQQYESLKRVGANVELLKSQMDLIKLDPCFEGTIARSALYFPESLHVNTMLATQSMLDSSKAQLIENTSVVGIKRSADGLYSLTLSNGIQMVCKHLVLANGIWLPELALKLNLLVPITPVRGQIWMTETVPEWFMNHIVFLVAAEYEFARYSSRCDIQGIPEKCTHNLNLEKIVSHAYGRKTVDGNILFGGDRVPLSSPWDHQKLYAADQELVEENRSYVYSFLPSLQAYEVEGAWAGPMPFSRDGKPIAGSLEKLGYANLWIIGGFGPSGIMEAPMVSQIVSQQISGKNILDKEFIDAALQEYSPLRPGCVTTLN